MFNMRRKQLITRRKQRNPQIPSKLKINPDSALRRLQYTNNNRSKYKPRTTIHVSIRESLTSSISKIKIFTNKQKQELDNNHNYKNYQQNDTLNMSSVSKTYNPPNYNLTNNNTNVSSNINSIMNNNNYKREICKEHNEDVSYFCLDCESRCICTECVVHGTHKSHDVLHIKKAYPLVTEKMNNLLNHVKDKIDDMNNLQSNIDAKKKEIAENTNTVKQQMANAFEEVRLRLLKKEKELMEKADVFLSEHIQEISTYSRVLQSNVISLNKIIDSINSHIIRRDEV